MSEVQTFLEQHVALLKLTDARMRCGWRSTMEFVLTHGRYWEPRALPADIKPMRVRHCFRNATELALGFHRNEFIYCEGYAAGIIPTAHAWLVDLEGNVIDPTWCQGGSDLIGLGKEYFGIAFKAAYVAEALVKQKTYGLIDAWEDDWPLLSAPVDEWMHPINLKPVPA